MDIFSHGLWSSVIAQGINKKKKIRRLNPWLAAWWGVFPDLFAFTIPFVWIFYERIIRGISVSFPRPEHLEPGPAPSVPAFDIAQGLYRYSHSLIIFVLVLAIIVFLKYFLSKRSLPVTPPYEGGDKGVVTSRLTNLIPWEMGGWLLHILCDIPTHSYKFYPTPFLWPISNLRFNGFSWGQWWFILLDYSLLIIVFVVLRYKKARALSDKTSI